MHALRIPVAVILGGAVHVVDVLAALELGRHGIRRRRPIPGHPNRVLAHAPRYRSRDEARRENRARASAPDPRDAAHGVLGRRHRQQRGAADADRRCARRHVPHVDVGGIGSRRHPARAHQPRLSASGTSRGLEGWVQVQFTITPTGTVANAVVVNAEPKNIFDDAALKAIARWRYNPKVEGGVAVERVGVQTIIRFQLEQ